MRATRSLGPPVVTGTTSLIGLLGYCAQALNASSTDSAAMNSFVFFTRLPPLAASMRELADARIELFRQPEADLGHVADDGEREQREAKPGQHRAHHRHVRLVE